MAPQDVPGLSFTFPAPALESTNFLMSPTSSYWRIVFRDQNLGGKCAIVTGMSLLPGSLGGKS